MMLLFLVIQRQRIGNKKGVVEREREQECVEKMLRKNVRKNCVEKANGRSFFFK